MRYFALATDYDGTLAHNGVVEPPAIAALERFRESGRRLLLVTGRELAGIQAIFPRLDLFDRVVAENGAVLYNPETKQESLLAEPPSKRFIAALDRAGVAPLQVGRVILATWESHSPVILKVIQSLGLELQLIFNKGAVMVVPAGVNKATGLETALTELGLSLHNTAGVGDAENDHAFLGACECAVAVADALPALKERADIVTRGGYGAGVIELIGSLIADDLRESAPRLARHNIPLGKRSNDSAVNLPVYGVNVLIAGASGSGKSTLTTGFIERLIESEYQVCVIDPEGDYQTLAGAAMLGDGDRAPSVDEVASILEKPGQSVVLNLIALPYNHQRPSFFKSLLPRLQELRSRTGRPHWIVVDEAHHLLPASEGPSGLILPQQITGMMLITVDPDHILPSMVAEVDTLIAVGENIGDSFRSFCAKSGEKSCPPCPDIQQRGQAIYWSRASGEPPIQFSVAPCRTERVRHSRKYACGELEPELSFYFRGPEGKLNLRAQNLVVFLQMAEGVDDATWMFHLRQGEYSRWFREAIMNEDLATEAERIERDKSVPPRESRAQIQNAIEQHFTLPA
ncbi:MAG: HAD-IIB family hydrolase [Acidobacteriota bacterium]|nr:HAD-IIB family hydrolase [Acidobacteriota bacterium]